MIGDSTMADKPLLNNPERGWGQLFPQYFSDGVEIKYQYPGWSITLNNALKVFPDLNEAISVTVPQGGSCLRGKYRDWETDRKSVV